MKSDEIGPEALSRLLSNVGTRDQALFTLMACTGARISEAVTALWKDWDPAANPPVLKLLVSKQRAVIYHRYQLHSLANLAILAWFNHPTSDTTGRYMFASRSNPKEPITPRQANRILAKAADAAGIAQNISTHSLRKYFARLLYEATHKDIMTVALALNHASVKSTMHYLQADRSQVDRLCLSLYHPFALPSFPKVIQDTGQDQDLGPRLA